MLASRSLRPESSPTPSVLRWLGDGAVPFDRERLNAKLREDVDLEAFRQQVVKDRGELAKNEAWLREHFDRPAPTELDADFLVQAADEANKKAIETGNQFHPVIEALSNLLTSPGQLRPENRDVVRDSIDILEGWLAFYCGFNAMLARLRDERLGTAPAVLRARPVKGKVDYPKLSREHMVRYPKIRARLAE
jgi:hypothetical protein